MMWNMLHKLRFAIWMLLAALLTPVSSVLAQDEIPRDVDARLMHYAPDNPVVLVGGSTGLTWLLFIFLSIITMGVLFTNAKRTHLD
jgi:hypothetical protein